MTGSITFKRTMDQTKQIDGSSSNAILTATRGLNKGQALGNLTGCEDDFACENQLSSCCCYTDDKCNYKLTRAATLVPSMLQPSLQGELSCKKDVGACWKF